MKILVIIVSYNFERWIDLCLGSLRQSTHSIDVVVIDNASKDRTIQRITQNYPEVRLVESQSNLGFGRANNIGMQIALSEGYTHLFLLNQDAWIEPDTIGTLASLSLEHPEYGVLSPVHLTGKGDKLDPGFGQYARIQNTTELPNNELVDIPFVNAALWMIPISVLKKIGGFCPLFYHYGEDKDFINRLNYHHFKVGYSPKVFGYHDREYRPVTHRGFLQNEYVYHLSEYANVNYPWIKAFGYGFLAIAKKMMKALTKRELSLSADYWSIMKQLISQSRNINTFREKNRLTNPHYIQEHHA